jgi:divinyl chlorophyllide a 8-vinyl-reductase
VTARALRVLLLGATGTIGRAMARELAGRGHVVVAPVRTMPEEDDGGSGVIYRQADVCDPGALDRDGICGERFDVLVSCLGSRTGEPKDAWAVDFEANRQALHAAEAAGAGQAVYLSAICVQKPKRAFQQAKLAFEAELQTSGLKWSIVRPTAFFKSLSGQVQRVKDGKPFLVFGDGTETACKPISDADLARFMADCMTDASRHNQILPIGGPGPAISPREQGQMLFDLTGREPTFKSVPPAMFSILGGALGTMGRIIPPLRARAELLRIAHYYATESMLVWNEVEGRYDAEATPEYGQDTLRQHYESLLPEATNTGLRDHKLF